jgi:hypothetical protein
MKVLQWFAVIGLCLAASAPLSAEDAVPEIRIHFGPARGYQPADGVAPAYLFTMTGVVPTSEPEPPAIVSAQLLVKPGHTRRESREYGHLRIEGDVKVDERGILMYRVALFRDGSRIAAASSSVSWVYPSGPVPR